MKRIFLPVFVCLILAAPGVGHAQELFRDVDPAVPFATYIKNLQQMGIFTGYPDKTFRADEPVTRGELAIVVARMMAYYEAALPKDVTMRKPDTAEADRVKSIVLAQAPEILEHNSVKVPAINSDNKTRPATVGDVIEVMTEAFSRLIEKVNLSYDEQQMLEEHDHDHDDHDHIH